MNTVTRGATQKDMDLAITKWLGGARDREDAFSHNLDNCCRRRVCYQCETVFTNIYFYFIELTYMVKKTPKQGYLACLKHFI